MGCKKTLFGDERNCRGIVAESATTPSPSKDTSKVAAEADQSRRGDIVVCAHMTEAGTSSCTPRRNEISSSKGIFSPSATLTARENATPDDDPKYTHEEDIDPKLIPRVGMSFKDRKEARSFYREYAEKVGFGLCYKNIKKCSYVIQCSCEGSNDYYKGNEDLRVRNKTTKKTHCKAKMKLKRIYDDNKVEVGVVIEQMDLMHNHTFLKKQAEKVNMEEHKEKDPVMLEMVDGLQAADVPHENIRSYVRDIHGGVVNIPMTTKDLENRKAANVREEHANDIAKLLDFFKDCSAQNPQFRWYIKLDKDGTIHSLFWSHASMQAEYIDFGEVMTFDTTHKTNKYEKPLALFVGANHHLQNTYFGCALLGDETTETFQWVFQAFKKCMGEMKTKCMLTDQDQAMEVAMGMEFPGVIHRICRWHVVNKHIPLLNELFCLHKKRNFKEKFRSVLNHPLTPAEFEAAWQELIKEFDLETNETMESLYRQRARYIPAYFKDDYCGMMTSTQRSESSNRAIKRSFVGKRTCLHKFAKRTLEFMQTQQRKDGTETYRSTSRTLTKTNWAFEEQLGRVYTRAVFADLKRKVVKCSSFNIEPDLEVGEHWYRVVHCKKSEVMSWGQHQFKVKADKVNEAYSCECRELEHTGLFCVHLLRAFIHVQVDKIPHDYIRRRYTRSARSQVDFDTNDQLLTGEDGNTQANRIKKLVPLAMKAVQAGSMSNAGEKRLVEVLKDVTSELQGIPKDIGPDVRQGQHESRAENIPTDSSSEDGCDEDDQTNTTEMQVSIGEQEQQGSSAKQREGTKGKEIGSKCIVPAVHVLECSEYTSHKRASAGTCEEMLPQQEEQSTTISLLPPAKAKPKGRDKTEAEKEAITLGAQGKKLGTRKCKACGLYATHNARTCLSLEHNRIRLEEMKSRKRGRPKGAKNKNGGCKGESDRDREEELREQKRRLVEDQSSKQLDRCTDSEEEFEDIPTSDKDWEN